MEELFTTLETKRRKLTRVNKRKEHIKELQKAAMAKVAEAAKNNEMVQVPIRKQPVKRSERQSAKRTRFEAESSDNSDLEPDFDSTKLIKEDVQEGVISNLDLFSEP